MSDVRRDAQLAADQKMIDGVLAHLAQFAFLSVDGQKVTSADIVKIFQDRIAAAKAVVSANAARDAALLGERDERAQTTRFVSSLRRVVLGMFTHDPATLAAFGMAPPKVPVKNVATKAAAVAKNKATRKARGTLGSKQKQQIHGVAVASPAPAKA